MREIVEAAPPPSGSAMPWPFFSHSDAIDRAAARTKCQRKSLKCPDSRKETALFSLHFSLQISPNMLRFMPKTIKTRAESRPKRAKTHASARGGLGRALQTVQPDNEPAKSDAGAPGRAGAAISPRPSPVRERASSDSPARHSRAASGAWAGRPSRKGSPCKGSSRACA